MTVSSDAELRALTAVGQIVGRALAAMVSRVRAGVTTRELDAVAAGVLARHGARSAPQLVYDFPGVSCISVNEEVVHGVPGDRVLRPGDLVTVDVAAEKDGLMADAARTVVVPGGSRENDSLVACAEAAFDKALKAARFGNRVFDLGAAIELVAMAHGFTAIRDVAGHGIGREIHEEPAIPCYFDAAFSELLVPGMVLAIEPMISVTSEETRILDDGWTVATADGCLSAHHENTVLITDGAPIVLTELV